MFKIRKSFLKRLSCIKKLFRRPYKVQNKKILLLKYSVFSKTVIVSDDKGKNQIF